jgi:hypothetical protein
MPFDLLEANLLDLLWELRSVEIPLIVGGGYGLFLKQRQLRRTGERTLLSGFPEPRATNDLDLFLRTEILADSSRVRLLADALGRLGCEPVETAKYLQFVRVIPGGGQPGTVKFDLLTGPAHPGVDLGLIRTDSRRWRPRGERIPLHAHPTPEALALESLLREIVLDGPRTTGEAFTGSVFVPQPFSYALMKLFAFRDRREDPSKELGQHHALDLYTILATTTEPEWQAALHQSVELRTHETTREARRIVAEYFSGPEALGALRVREHQLFSPQLDLSGFLSALGELFG